MTRAETDERDGARIREPGERKQMTVTSSHGPERKDDMILLAEKKMSGEAIEQYVNPLIRQRLEILAREGWEADGPMDALALWRQGRLACRRDSSFWMDNHTYTLASVTIRLRRINIP